MRDPFFQRYLEASDLLLAAQCGAIGRAFDGAQSVRQTIEASRKLIEDTREFLNQIEHRLNAAKKPR